MIEYSFDDADNSSKIHLGPEFAPVIKLAKGGNPDGLSYDVHIDFPATCRHCGDLVVPVYCRELYVAYLAQVKVGCDGELRCDLIWAHSCPGIEQIRESTAAALAEHENGWRR